MGKELYLKVIALTFVPSLIDSESEVAQNQINPEVKNTFFTFRQRYIIDKYVDITAKAANFKMISSRLNQTTST